MFGHVFGAAGFIFRFFLPQGNFFTHFVTRLKRYLWLHCLIYSLRLTQCDLYRQRRGSYG